MSKDVCPACGSSNIRRKKQSLGSAYKYSLSMMSEMRSSYGPLIGLAFVPVRHIWGHLVVCSNCNISTQCWGRIK